MTILIIEDDEAIRNTLRDILEIEGHKVLSASDGLEGVRLAKSKPDFILCDITMPEMDGYEVVAVLHQDPLTRDIPFIFLTALADRQSHRRGMNLGADDFITKPFSSTDILEAIAARVHRQKPLRERIENLITEHRREANAEWSHELMTPLNGVLGGLELIEAEADTIKPDELKELLGLIRSGAERQLSLARKLITYYELERIRTSPPTNAASCEASRAILAGANRAAEEQHRSGDMTVQCDPATLPTFESHMASAVAELVGNAFRFSNRGEPVRVTGRKTQGTYVIEVQDQGTGMSAEECASVAPFRQFGRSQHNQEGLGLGLAIAKSVAETRSGNLRLDTDPGGKGVRAVLQIPCA